MNSEEYAKENPWITYTEASRLISNHGTTIDDYFEDTGDSVTKGDLLNTKAILVWLGY